ncbi:MAG: FG-GAP-like repeat-containing protein [Planctomycetota bacterium]
MLITRTLLGLSFAAVLSPLGFADDDHFLHEFERHELTGTYFSEGAGYGDLNNDGHVDVVYGPYWYEGPDWKTAHEIYEPVAQNVHAYADNFFAWVYDFDGDGWRDVFVVGFPSKPAYVYENPGKDGQGEHWPKHEVFNSVSNESPHFTQIAGDERPELVCTRGGRFGYATWDPKQPFERWTFHPLSEPIAARQFGHGLGVGDVNGDGRHDVLMQHGWFEQPKSLDGDPMWTLHQYVFAPKGGAEMYAYDVDGDGDQDVITSLEAHEYGLAWFENKGDGTDFERHVIMGWKPEDNPYGVLFTELHSVALADMDGDGLKDIVTGKTYWSHHEQSPMWDAGAVVYWFKLVRGEAGVQWIPYQADDDSGIGRQVNVADVTGNGQPDIILGGMKGCHVITHTRKKVSAEEWQDAQPKVPAEMRSGLLPEEAAAHMTVPAGFDVKLAAGEPQVHQPIAMAIDGKGRVWVAEAYTYPQRAPEGKGRDKIVILEDTTGDGALDQRKVFIEGLNLVSGLEVGFGGVWVGAAPYFLFIPDADGDDRPDGEPQILLDGFGYQDTHETLNAFNWGPDGWLYGCHGVFTHSKVGKPGTKDADRTPMNAAVWRYHPIKHEFEVFAWGSSNPWGVDFNDRGHAFITACVIPHLFHVIQGARYQRQGGTHFNQYVFDDIKTIADHAHYAGNIGDHAWWGQEPESIPTNTSDAGGGHAHCGAMIYLGDNWPEKYRNQLYFSNIHGNRINCDALVPEGSGYVGTHSPDFLMANDHWFRGINLRAGPDGSVYLIDWYDKNACHRNSPEIWDRSNGRVYNVTYGDVKRRRVDLAKMDDIALAELQKHTNEWHARMSRKELQQRAAQGNLSGEVVAALWKIADASNAVPLRLRAIWTLHTIGKLTAGDFAKLRGDTEPDVRAWAIQLDLEDRTIDEKGLAQLEKMAAQDASPVVRLALTSALQRLPLEQRWTIAEALSGHGEDAEDHNLPLMIWYGIEPLVLKDTARAMRLATRSEIPLLTRFITRRAAADPRAIDAVVAILGEAKDDARRKMILGEMLQAFEGRADLEMPPAWEKAYAALLANPDAEVRDRADQVAIAFGDKRILPRLRSVLTDASAGMKKRQQALEFLVQARDPEAAKAFQQVLGNGQLRGSALKALAQLSDPGTPQAILDNYANLSQTEKRDAISALTTRPAYAGALLDAVQAGTIPSRDLHAYHVRQLRSFNDAKLDQRITKVWGEVRETSEEKKAGIERVKALVAKAKDADPSHGRMLFQETCSTCHMLFGEGEDVGPDITGSNRSDLDYLLENVFDPSAVLGNDYRSTVAWLEDGRIVSGLLRKETDSALTLRTLNDTVVVPKSEIEDRQLQNISVMPEGLLEPLSDRDVVDLVAYLRRPVQVPVRGARSPIDPKTGIVKGAIEGESMKVLSKSAGKATSQAMGGFPADKWSHADHLWWTGAKPGDRLELAVPVSKSGTYDVDLVMTRARDYGIVQLAIDDQRLGGPIDLYNDPDVITTGVLTFKGIELTEGEHRLVVEITGAHPDAVKAYMFGLDYVALHELGATGGE